MSDRRIPFDELNSTLTAILLKSGFTEGRARRCAALFAEASLDGVASHGANRFPAFLRLIREGYIKVDAEPLKIHASGVVERWDGQLGPGNLNARHSMERAVKLAKRGGIGCVFLKNTNHWMRGGSYAWQAVENDCIGICFTNTKANMPAWGGSEPRIGNNPLVIGIPRKKGPVVLDMAMTQFSYGKMESYLREQKKMPYEAGFDEHGNLTKDPSEILENELALPAGLWKGAGLSLMLDILVTILSEGYSTHQISEFKEEYGISQGFICLSLRKMGIDPYPEDKIDAIIENLKASPSFGSAEVRYPGEKTLRTRQRNLESGVPVNKEVWDRILRLTVATD